MNVSGHSSILHKNIFSDNSGMFFYIFIQQGRIKLIKSDSKDIYNITKDYISEILQN